jgi:hypothetical protein
MPDTTLPKAPGTAVLQDYYGNHCRKTVAHVMVLWKYKPLDPNDAFWPKSESEYQREGMWQKGREGEGW